MGPYYLLLSVLMETTPTKLRPDCYSTRIQIRKAPHRTFFSQYLTAALLVSMIQHCHLLVVIHKILFWVGLKYINYWKQSKRLAWNELTKLNGPLLSKITTHLQPTFLSENKTERWWLLQKAFWISQASIISMKGVIQWCFTQNCMYQTRDHEKKNHDVIQHFCFILLILYTLPTSYA